MPGATLSIGGFEERIVTTIDGLPIYARDYAPLLPETGLPVICLIDTTGAFPGIGAEERGQ